MLLLLIMKPRKVLKYHSFLYGLGKLVVGQRRLRARWTSELALDLDAYHNFDVEAELTALLNQELTEEIDRNFANTGRLLYLDYVYSEPKYPTVYDDGSWSMGNTFEGVIGIKSEIKPHTFI